MIKKFQKILILLLLTLTTLISSAFINSKPASAANTGEAYIGQIQLFAFNFEPRGWVECKGQILPISQNTALFSLIGTTFGGDGTTTFALPDMQNCSPLPNAKYYIAMNGVFPTRYGSPYDDSGLYMISSTVIFPYNFAPPGWALCDGSSLDISQADALFTLIGTQYGGDYSNFNVPNLSQSKPIASNGDIDNLNYYICVNGIYPSDRTSYEDFVGTVDLFPRTFAEPLNGSVKCSGQTMSISQNTALFSLVGTNYGGDGTSTFGVPDLKGATPLPQMNYYMTTAGIFPSRN